MNTELLLVSLGGLFVLFSYLFLYYSPGRDEAWGGIEGQTRMVWVASTALTTVSYLFLWVAFVWLIEERSMLLLVSWSVFLTSAGAVVLHHAFGLEGREEELVSSGQPLDYRFGVRGNFYRVCFDRVFLATLAPR